MKLKYKKMVILISMCTMGIGLVTFSMTTQSKKTSTKVEETAGDMVAYNPQTVQMTDLTDEGSALLSITPQPTATPETDSTLSAKAAEETTDTQESEEPVVSSQPLEKNAYDDINSLIKNYLNAKLTSKKTKFKTLVNDTSLLDMDDIARKTQYIEKYKNVTCYTQKGPEENSYIVYAYHEVKFTSIKTLAPAMNRFYVKRDSDGKPYIYLGKIDSDTETYLNEVNESQEVTDLINSVDKKLQKAVKKDDALSKFYLKLEESAKSVSKNETKNE